MKQENFCPCCGRHCDLRMPKCECGEEYQRTGVITAKPHHGKEKQWKSDRLKRYQEADIQKKLIINLRDINHVMRSLYEGKGSQKRILIVLKEVGNMTQSELTERLGIQPGSASEVIAKLEDAGNLVRVPSESDRRTMDIVLTEQGHALAEATEAQLKKRHEEMFSCLSDEEKNSLLKLLEKINEDWETRYQEMGKEQKHSGGHPKGHGHHGRGEEI